MIGIDWHVVATSATTAVFVTLVVEYFAKPRLEARKERILDLLRSRRVLMAAIVDMALLAHAILAELPKDADAELKARFREERQRQYARMEERARSLFEEAGRFAAAYGPLRELILSYLLCVHGVMLSLRTQHRKAEIVANLAVPISMVLTPPRLWRIPAWVKAVTEVKSLIAETKEAPPPTVSLGSAVAP